MANLHLPEVFSAVIIVPLDVSLLSVAQTVWLRFLLLTFSTHVKYLFGGMVPGQASPFVYCIILPHG